MDWLLGVLLIGAFVSVLIYSNRPKREDLSKDWVTAQYGPPDDRESNPTYQLLFADTPQKVELLIRNGANVNHLDKSHPTFWMRPLHSALRSPDIVKVLLRHGADPNGRDTTLDYRTGRPESHRTPLQALLTKLLPNAPLAEVTRELIAAGAKVDVTDGDGNTLLHLAARNSSGGLQQIAEVVEGLLAAGVSARTQNRTGQTASEIIRTRQLQHQERKRNWALDPLNSMHLDLADWERDDVYLRELEAALRNPEI